MALAVTTPKPILPSYAKADLPQAGSPGKMAMVTDAERGAWLDSGTQWWQIAGLAVNVQSYGAVGDGVTDDTAAIDAAINAVRTLGGGVVLFPTGNYRRTTQQTGYSGVHWYGYPGSTITADVSGGQGFSLYDVFECTLHGLNFVRLGANGTWDHCVSIAGASDRTLRVESCIIDARGTGSNITGLLVSNTASPTVITSRLRSDRKGTTTQQTCSPLYQACICEGGSGGTGAHGASTADTSTPIFAGGTKLLGGSGGSDCYGLSCSDMSAPVAIGAHMEGGSGGNNCYGAYAGGASRPVLQGGVAKGGDGGTGCTAIFSGSGTPEIHGTTCINGSGGTGCRGVDLQSGAGAVLKGVKTVPPQLSQVVQGVTATSTFTLPAKPCQLSMLMMYVNVAGGVGATISVGSVLGGVDIVNAQAITTTGYKYPLLGVGRLLSFAAGATIFVTIAGAGNPNVDIYYDVYVNYASCEALRIGSNGVVRVDGGEYVSGCESDAVYILNPAIAGNLLMIAQAYIEAKPKNAGSMKAINAQAAYNPAPIYNSTLVGGTTNIVAAAGVANGSNIEV